MSSFEPEMNIHVDMLVIQLQTVLFLFEQSLANNDIKQAGVSFLCEVLMDCQNITILNLSGQLGSYPTNRKDWRRDTFWAV